MSTDGSYVHQRSHLFTVRIWEEEMGSARLELRGRVQLLTSGETRYFREWEQLVPLLLKMLAEQKLDLE